MSYTYIDTTDFNLRFPDWQIGTSATHFVNTSIFTPYVQSASEIIDIKLSSKYGTYRPLFGTNSEGTNSVPQIIKDITCDITMGLIFTSRALDVTENQIEWGKAIYQRGLNLIEEIINQNYVFAEFAGKIVTANAPVASLNSIPVVSEKITFDGTKWVNLGHQKVVHDSITVFGTEMYAVTEFKENFDYEIKYYNKNNADNWTKIRTHGTGNIPAGAEVYVNYEYIPDKIFEINDKNWKITEDKR